MCLAFALLCDSARNSRDFPVLLERTCVAAAANEEIVEIIGSAPQQLKLLRIWCHKIGLHQQDPPEQMLSCSMSCRPTPSCSFLRGKSTGTQLLLIYWCVICLFKKVFIALIPGGEGRSLLRASKWSLLPDQLLLHPLLDCNPYRPSQHSLLQDLEKLKEVESLEEQTIHFNSGCLKGRSCGLVGPELRTNKETCTMPEKQLSVFISISCCHQTALREGMIFTPLTNDIFKDEILWCFY